MVSMSIFAVISGFVLVNFRQGGFQDETRLGAESAAQVIRETLTLALAGHTARICVVDPTTKRVCTATSPACATGCIDDVPKGWGVAFGTAIPTGIMVFADLDGDKVRDVGEDVRLERYGSSGALKATTASPAAAETTVVFTPPVPEVFVNGAQAATDASVTVKHDIAGAQRTIRFNRISRRIEVTNP